MESYRQKNARNHIAVWELGFERKTQKGIHKKRIEIAKYRPWCSCSDALSLDWCDAFEFAM